MERLTDTELSEFEQNMAEARASLACEGLFFTDEEEALLQQFAAERLQPEERRRRAIEFCRQQRSLKVHAAE
jgi:hypothetical protein